MLQGKCVRISANCTALSIKKINKKVKMLSFQFTIVYEKYVFGNEIKEMETFKSVYAK